MSLIVILIVLLLLFGCGGFYGYRSGAPWGAPGIGLFGIILIILLVMFLSGRI